MGAALRFGLMRDDAICWRSPEELLDIAVEHSRLVLVNEAHNGMLRSVRTRQVGLRMIDRAHVAGVRHLAIEALQPHDAGIANQSRRLPDRPGYLGQPEMRELIAAALDRGWELISYEADMTRKPPEFNSLSNDETNWREAEQANNLGRAVWELPGAAPLLVWCGNHHLAKSSSDWWRPMGALLYGICGIEPFSIDQTLSVRFSADQARAAPHLVETFASTLNAMGGTAGFLAEDAPDTWPDQIVAKVTNTPAFRMSSGAPPSS